MPDEADEVTVTVPDQNFRMPTGQRPYYEAAQGLTKAAIDTNGTEAGISVVLSGVTREMRRHMSDGLIAGTLRGFAETIGDARRLDEKD